MALLLRKMYQGYFYAVNDLRDTRADDKLTMSSPLCLVAILSLYIFTVKKVLPTFMENRRPYDLKNVLIVYNIMQILGNFYYFYMVLPYIKEANVLCTPSDYSNDPKMLNLINIQFVYYCLKLFDLVDTVFFVLRKSYRQVSFLHVYHHSGMIITGWIGVRYIPTGHSIWLPFINSIVHMLMFGYYLLTAVDSKWKKNLTMKKLITQIQLAQFAFLVVAYGVPILNNCKYEKITGFLVIQAIFMIILFMDFYRKTYWKKTS